MRIATARIDMAIDAGRLTQGRRCELPAQLLRRLLWLLWPLLLATGWSMPVQAAQEARACSEVTPITQARRTVTQDGRILADSTVSLPDKIPLQWRDQRVHLQYEIDVSACADARSAALSVFRVGAPYTLNVQGQPLQSLLSHRWFGHSAGLPDAPATPDDMVFNGRIPALLALPRGADKAVITLQTLPYIPSGLIRLTVGPTNALMPLAVSHIDAVVGFTGAAAGVMLVLAMMASLLWLQRRHDLGFLWMTLACLFWSLRALAYFDQTVYLPPLWFEQFNPYNILLTAITLCAATLGNEMQQRRPGMAKAPTSTDWRRRPRQALVFAFVSATLVVIVSLVSDHGALLARAYAQSWAAGLSLVTIWWVWTGKVRLAQRHRIATILAYLSLIACAVHDMALVTGDIDPAGPSYLFWGFTLVLVVYALISGDYIIRTLNRAENVNMELEQRINSKSAELENSYLQLRKTEMAGALSSARLQERERLLRDMHDGLGAHLMTALRGVERSALNPDQIAQSLQDGIDELRMMMDSTDMGADLPAALAAWRNRWDNRLGAAGVQLHWHLDDALDNMAVDSDALLQIMRILQEAATNVVKHSGARNLRLKALHVVQPGQTSLVIETQDDGRGLPAQDTQPHQRGLKNMVHRATQIGATLEIATVQDGNSKGCRVRFTLPIDPPPKRPERRKSARPDMGLAGESGA
jgi:signal transduction histidine kinase